MSQFIQKVDNGYIAWGEPTLFGIIISIIFWTWVWITANQIDNKNNVVSESTSTNKITCIELQENVNVRSSMKIKKDNIVYVAPKGTKFCNYENVNNWIKVDSNRYISKNVTQKLLKSEKGE